MIDKDFAFDESLDKFFESVVDNYHGDSHSLYAAVGAFICCRYLGWRVVRLTVAGPTYLKYQKILGGIDFKTIFPEETKYSHKSLGLSLVKTAKNLYWKVINGRASIDSKEKRTLTPTEVCSN